MAAPRPLTRLVAPAALLVVIGAALVVPVPPASEVPWTPVEAAQRAEATLPALGLSWGRLRGWSRAGGAWLLVWQPAHGAWLVRTLVPDGAGRPQWRLDVASWLPGARLSRGAAALLLDFPSDPAVADDRLARRDWRFGEERLAGALPAGEVFAAPGPSAGGGPWDAVLWGLLLAGVVARMVFPALPVKLLRRATAWSAAALLGASLWLTPLAAGQFRVGVRPWVTQLVVWSVAVLVLGAVIVVVMSVPAAYGPPTPQLLGLCLAAGVLAGRLAPGSWAPEVEGLTVRGLVLASMVVVGGWLGALGADGLRQMLGGTVRWRRLVLAVLAAVAVASAGDRTGPVLAVLVAASVERPYGVWAAGLTLLGWIVGAVLVTCAWTAAVVDALLLFAIALALVLMLALRSRGVAAA